MHVHRLILFCILCAVAPLLAAQPSQTGSTPADVVSTPSVPRAVFNSGTNAYNLSLTVPATVGVGRSAGIQVTVTPIDGYHQPVKLTCDKLPPETSCSFDTQTIPAGGGTTTLLLNTSAPRDCGTNTPYFYGSLGLNQLGSVMAGLLLLCLPLRRWRMRGLLGLVALCAMLGLQGCGHCTDLGTRPGTYQFIVNGTGQDTVALALGDLVTVPVTIDVNE